MSTNKFQFKLTKVNPAYWRATFDNPPINMLGPETMLELQGLVGQFEKDPGCVKTQRRGDSIKQNAMRPT